MEPRELPDLVEGTAALVVVVVVNADFLRATVGVEGGIDGRGRACFVHERDREQRGRGRATLTSAQSKYESVQSTSSRLSRCARRYRAISAYRSQSVISIARQKLQRNGTSARTAETPVASAAAARLRPPPWLSPQTATRSGSTSGRLWITLTARTASTNTRR